MRRRAASEQTPPVLRRMMSTPPMLSPAASAAVAAIAPQHSSGRKIAREAQHSDGSDGSDGGDGGEIADGALATAAYAIGHALGGDAQDGAQASAREDAELGIVGPDGRFVSADYLRSLMVTFIVKACSRNASDEKVAIELGSVLKIMLGLNPEQARRVDSSLRRF